MVLLLLLLFVIALWFLVWEWRRGARRKRLLGLLGRVREGNDRFDDLVGDRRYFACRDEVLFLEAYDELRGEIGTGFERLGLEGDVVEVLGLFCGRFEGCGILRAEYNEGFVRREAERYAEFFAGLEDYPLSGDQVEAVIRDEDNNLVLAGAGTGKTTTISAKVAYVLEKGLARPEELLAISFTNNAPIAFISFGQRSLGNYIHDGEIRKRIRYEQDQNKDGTQNVNGYFLHRDQCLMICTDKGTMQKNTTLYRIRLIV